MYLTSTADQATAAHIVGADSTTHTPVAVGGGGGDLTDTIICCYSSLGRCLVPHAGDFALIAWEINDKKIITEN